MTRRGLDGFLVSGIKNIRYLCGFTGDSAYLLIGRERDWFLTDSRYVTQARAEVKGAGIRVYKKPLEAIAELADEHGLRLIGFESDNLTVDACGRFRKALGRVRLKPFSGLLDALRSKKDPFEVERIRRSVRILTRCYGVVERMLRPGARECDIALAVEAAAKADGAEAMAFDTIMASGPRGALPHGKASDKRIRNGELVVVDMGVVFDGYNSDCTRTYCIGRATARVREVYQTVLDAQMRAIEMVRPGVAAAEIDRVAREHIDGAGYGAYFGHGTGHGVGLEIHERPGIGPFGKEVLAEGMVITVEPGIYIPGWGGVRIEDMLLVTADGFEILTKAPKGLVCI
ncbi:MAG: aminopeptidase P family protein [Deltaproteobacteria bacterium]|nr:aminopeptidase P family protein [Deltaproteobacteria bacterium]